METDITQLGKLKSGQKCDLVLLGKLTLVFALGWVGGGCGRANESLTWRSIGNIQFDPNMDAAHFKLLKDDFKLLDSLAPTEGQAAQLKNILKIQDVTSSSLTGWLEERVKFVVGESFNIKNVFRVSSTEMFWPEPPTPYHRELFSDFAISYDHTFSATNPGSNIYDYCEQGNKVCGLELDGVGLVQVKSPRIGFVQLFDKLFSDLSLSGDKSLKDRSQEDIFYRIHRLSTIFHEARHSDGNKSSPGVPADHALVKKDRSQNITRKGTRNFVHVMCPKGHELQDQYACDLSLNGPYKIQALIAEVLAKSCSTCSASTLSIIETYVSKLNNRLVEDGAKAWNDAPESMI